MTALRILGIALMLSMGSIFTARAQQAALKTNLLYDATTTPNLGVEVSMGRRSTAQVVYALNPWKFSHAETKQLRHWLLMPEYRHWFCQKFNGAYLGVHALGGQFNIGGIDLPLPVFDDLDQNRYEGWFAGAGVTFGYQWLLSRHWNLEAGIGLGYLRFHYKQFPCTECGALIQETNKNYFGPTKLALSVMYCF